MYIVDSARQYYKQFKKTPNKRDELWALATDPRKLAIPAFLYLLLEVVLNTFVIETVPYTEIDWKAYMQEVEGVINGTYDYSQLKGDTGPLAYPAGFVYIFTALYYVTVRGTYIKFAQYIYSVLYYVLLVLVFDIYRRAKKVPPYVLILAFLTSYRIHSIFVLRLFNDPVAMVLLYGAIVAFLNDKWYLGSVLYSVAVSVKMNILLYAPALLIAYMTNLGYKETTDHLLICAIIQLFLGWPFLMNNPAAYINGAFNLGRIFEFKWTVNWRFLSEDFFVNPYFHITLLGLHIIMLIYFVPKWIKYLASYNKIMDVQRNLKSQLNGESKIDMSVSSTLFVLPMFIANFLGIVFSRSLHYQFYVWYYHTLPYLLWTCDYKTHTRLLILGLIELCWNIYPSTIYSSLCLHICHFIILYGLDKHMTKSLEKPQIQLRRYKLL